MFPESRLKKSFGEICMARAARSWWSNGPTDADHANLHESAQLVVRWMTVEHFEQRHRRRRARPEALTRPLRRFQIMAFALDGF